MPAATAPVACACAAPPFDELELAAFAAPADPLGTDAVVVSVAVVVVIFEDEALRVPVRDAIEPVMLEPVFLAPATPAPVILPLPLPVFEVAIALEFFVTLFSSAAAVATPANPVYVWR